MVYGRPQFLSLLQKQTQIFRLAALAQDDIVAEGGDPLTKAVLSDGLCVERTKVCP